MAHAAKLWEACEEWRSREVVAENRGRRFAVLRRDWAVALKPVVEGRERGIGIKGGRGGTTLERTERGRIVVRRFLRGGAMRWLGHLYFGWTPRPLTEFWLLVRARRRGLPVPEPLAAFGERRFLFVYKGALAMSEIGSAVSFDGFLRERPSDDWIPILARALRMLHDGGLLHPDLNVRNILAVRSGGALSFVFVDLDRARLYDWPLGERARRRSFARLRRSTRKLDPGGMFLSDANFDRLERAYGSGARDWQNRS